jgi:very-short-patch-repair endonuclease
LKALKQAITQHRPVPVTANGMTYVIDCLWRDETIAVELDGRDGHPRELAFEADRRRDAAPTWQRVNYEPAETLADLTAAMNRSSLS